MIIYIGANKILKKKKHCHYSGRKQEEKNKFFS